MKKIYTSIILSAILALHSSFKTTVDVDYYNFINDNKAKTIRFYPNPATSYVIFEATQTPEKGARIQVYNSIGKKITELPLATNKITLSLDNYYRGIYVFVLVDKNGQMIETGRFQVVK